MLPSKLYPNPDIHEAAFCGNNTEVELALEKGQSPDIHDETGTSAVHKAASNGHIHILEIFKEKGCDMNQLDVCGCTPIHASARNGHLEALKWLVDHGGDVKIKSNKGRAALDVAKAIGRSEITTFLRNSDRVKMAWELD